MYQIAVSYYLYTGSAKHVFTKFTYEIFIITNHGIYVTVYRESQKLLLSAVGNHPGYYVVFHAVVCRTVHRGLQMVIGIFAILCHLGRKDDISTNSTPVVTILIQLSHNPSILGFIFLGTCTRKGICILFVQTLIILRYNFFYLLLLWAMFMLCNIIIVLFIVSYYYFIIVIMLYYLFPL
ncbi:pA179L [African swine fever virus]|uniref:PA179L n=1 Tax=African swine fever virus TaxID=10497 RepID=A0A8A1V3C8_ASF|nr:pA179L [African swine fever virus]